MKSEYREFLSGGKGGAEIRDEIGRERMSTVCCEKGTHASVRESAKISLEQQPALRLQPQLAHQYV